MGWATHGARRPLYQHALLYSGVMCERDPPAPARPAHQRPPESLFFFFFLGNPAQRARASFKGPQHENREFAAR